MVYFELFESAKLVDSPQNLRNQVDERFFARGLFVDRNKEAIMERWKSDDGVYHRQMIYPNLYSHIVGYNSYQYGKSGLEYKYNASLLNLSSSNPISKLKGQILDEGVGKNIQLTIDHGLQMKAYYALEGHKGAIIAMDPRTGEILAMVSMPSFNVTNIEQDWNTLFQMEKESPFLNRASQGLYPSGSVMKPITGLSLLKENIDLEYDDKGTTVIDGFTYSNIYGMINGHISLKEALIYSSNIYFADKVQELPPSSLRSTMDEFMLNTSIPFDLPTQKASIFYDEGITKTEKASLSFGQGDGLVTPLHICLAYSAIANGGKIEKPVLVKAILNSKNEEISRYSPEIISEIQNKEDLPYIIESLEETMKKNESQAQIASFQVAGKTGTAENKSDQVHAWFAGFAPSKDPELVITVLLEEEGEGGEAAASPIAGELFRYWFEEK